LIGDRAFQVAGARVVGAGSVNGFKRGVDKILRGQ